ncbi:hypothetical protein SK128_018034, partial [Halocaridina rubra]
SSVLFSSTEQDLPVCCIPDRNKASHKNQPHEMSYCRNAHEYPEFLSSYLGHSNWVTYECAPGHLSLQGISDCDGCGAFFASDVGVLFGEKESSSSYVAAD